MRRDQGIVATVNDIPITSFDIDQRLRLLEILGQKQEANDARKKALHMMIDEVIKIAEAKKYKVNATDKEIDAQMGRVAKGLQTDAAGLRAKLQSQGIAIASLKQYVAAQIAFARILGGKYQVKIKVEPAEVDKKFAEIKQDLEQKVSTIMNDPRMKSVQVYTILEIDLPVEAQMIPCFCRPVPLKPSSSSRISRDAARRARQLREFSMSKSESRLMRLRQKSQSR